MGNAPGVLFGPQTFRNRALRAAGGNAALLYVAALEECANAGTDGVMDMMLVKDAANLYELKNPGGLARRLVAAEHWHDAVTLQECGPCLDKTPEIDPGTFLVHRWWDMLLDAAGKDDMVARAIGSARRWLQRTAEGQKMVEKVRKRDRDECQYCGIHTRWEERKAGDKKSLDLGELDHLDPFATVLNTVNNLVVACKGCNGGANGKGQRTPDQWHRDGGMLLRSTCLVICDTAWRNPRSVPDPFQISGDRSPDPAAPIPDLPRVTRDSPRIPDQNHTDPGPRTTDQIPDPEPTYATNGNGAHHA